MESGNRLRELRKTMSLTQQQLADATGVSQPSISQLESGILSMDIQWMRSFACALKCSPADLLTDDDNPDRLRSEFEKHLIERCRKADEAQRQMLDRVTAAVVSP